jgi:histidinol-phosphate aminotransferase
MALQLNRRQWMKATAAAATWLWVSSEFQACRREGPQPLIFSEDDLLRLDNNENPYGVAPQAREAIVEAIRGSHRYPHRLYSELVKMIAAKEGLAPENIILGAGSTEVMNMAIFAYGVKGEVLTSDPTYFDFIFYAKQAGSVIRPVPVDENLVIELEAMANQIQATTSLIYICNPNNPTGTIIAGGNLRSFCEEASRQALVLVDEAYHEYVEDNSYSSMVSLVREGKKILVTRTFSKIFGLAGLRVGYGMAHPEIIAKLEKVQMNFASIAYPSLRAALAAYTDGEFTRSVKEKNKWVKAYLEKELDRLGFYRVPSQTNFLLFEVHQESKEVATALEKQRVLVRPFSFGGRNWLRVSIGTMEEIKSFLAALKRIERHIY